MSAWRAGKLSTDQMVRYAALNVVHRSAVPTRWRNARQASGLAGLYYGYVLSQAVKASPATRRWLRQLATPTRLTRSAIPRAAAGTSAQSAAEAPPGNLAAECAQTATIFLYDFICLHRTAHFAIYYNLKVVRPDGIVQVVGLPGDDKDGNGLPDALDSMSEGLESAYTTYSSMGYQVDSGADPLLVMVGVDDGGAKSNSAITLPTGLSKTGGAPFIMLSSDPGAENYNYLPRHELFHAFQYHYIPLDHLVADLDSVNWWMEATAEWAAHQSYLADPTAATADPNAAARYARTLDSFFGAPSRALNAWDGLSASRQYGAFVFAQFLTEYTHDKAAILHTWEDLGETLPLESVQRVLSGYGLQLASAYADFAARNYLSSESYADPDAQTVWRDALKNNNLTAADALGPARPARERRDLAVDVTTTGVLNLQPGGAAYVDLNLPAALATGAPRTLSINLDSQADLRFWLMSWNPQTSYPNLSASSGPLTNGDQTVDQTAGDLTVDLGPTPTHVTLVVTRVDVVADSGAAAEDNKPATWTATTGTAAPGIWAWGENSHGAAGRPDGLSLTRPAYALPAAKVVAVTGGDDDGFAVFSDGSLWGWGSNGWGQLGDGSTNDATAPKQLPLDNVTAVAGAQFTTYALRSDGTVWSWGDGRNGALGNGTSTGSIYETSGVTGKPGSATPVQVTGLSDVVAIAAGMNDGFAVRRDGSLWAWGLDDSDGELGDNSTQDKLTPVQVPGLSGVVSVAACGRSAYALTSDGTVWAWGVGADGELGNGVHPDYDTLSRVPVHVIGLSGVTRLAAGIEHVVALRSDGSVWGWGGNFFGGLTTAAPATRNSVPFRLAGFPAATAVAAGWGSTYALGTDGSVWATGQNGEGELGIGSTSDTDATLRVSRLSHVTRIGAGWSTAYAFVEGN